MTYLPHMLDVVAQAAEARQLKNITTRQGYAESLPFADNAFDIVISRYSAHHWHDVGAALREVNRILKPGGRLIVMDVMSPGHPVRDIWLQTVEALRDTSHVRNYASGEWLTLINEANLIVDNLITDKLPLEFSSWVAENAYARSVSRRYSHLPTERIDRGENVFCLAE
ncbi:putative methyltransferase [Escherichia coli]|nr:putative methyltransferase [Escherichia coli]